PTELQRILARSRRHFIDEAFGEKRILGVTHRAPEADRNTDIRWVIFDPHVGDVVNLGNAFNSRSIDPIAKATERRTYHPRVPCDGPALYIKSGGERRVRGRSIEVLLRIVFACPREFDGNAHSL